MPKPRSITQTIDIYKQFHRTSVTMSAMDIINKAYFCLFCFIAERWKSDPDKELWRIHAHLLFVLTTGVLMWAYAFIALKHMDSPIPGYVGLATSLIHFCSLFLWRLFFHPGLIISIGLAAGMLHQGTFAYFDGGFSSDITIWFCLLPILAGIVGGLKTVFYWIALTVSGTLGFLLLDISGHNFPQALSSEGRLFSHILLSFGFSFCSLSLLYIYVYFDRKKKSLLLMKKEQVQDLLRVLIHDVTNPLLAAQAQLELFQKRKDKDSEKMQEQRLGKIKRSLDVIQDLSIRVRELHSNDLEKIYLEPSECSLMECCDYAKFIFEKQLNEKKLNIVCESNQNLEFNVDKELLKNQILLNLISNAIKFSNPGGIITLAAKKVPGEIHISVRDDGVGMNEDTLNRLRVFGAAKSSEGTQGEKGSGFGIRIVHTFVEKLNGKLQVYSKPMCKDNPDHGTEFIVTLPS